MPRDRETEKKLIASKTEQRRQARRVCLMTGRFEYTRGRPAEMTPARGGIARWGRFFEAALFRLDQDMPAPAAFENAMSEMAQARQHGGEVHNSRAFRAIKPLHFVQRTARRRLNFRHGHPQSGGSATLSSHRQRPEAKRIMGATLHHQCPVHDSKIPSSDMRSAPFYRSAGIAAEGPAERRRPGILLRRSRQALRLRKPPPWAHGCANCAGRTAPGWPRRTPSRAGTALRSKTPVRGARP
jgi:hypothetical protein